MTIIKHSDRNNKVIAPPKGHKPRVLSVKEVPGTENMTLPKPKDVLPTEYFFAEKCVFKINRLYWSWSYITWNRCSSNS